MPGDSVSGNSWAGLSLPPLFSFMCCSPDTMSLNALARESSVSQTVHAFAKQIGVAKIVVFLSCI